MRHSTRLLKIAAIFLAAALLLTGTALALTLGDEIDGWETRPVQGAALARGVYWTGSDYRSENYIELSRGGSVFPVVASADLVCSARSFASLAASLESSGLHVVAGINGGYYELSSYEPVGILVKDGKLLSSDGGLGALGFRGDGSVIIGSPGVVGSISANGETRRLLYINKAREENDFALFTSEYSQTTRANSPGRDVLCSPVSGALSVSGSMTLSVTEILDSDGAASIPSGGFVLSLAETADAWLHEFVDKLSPGDEITVTTSCAPEWANVTYAVGALYRLVTGGEVNEGLDASAAPRTAVGLRADGTLVLYTIDGRQPGLSVGASMTQVARRMTELGCVDAVLMDGGGSTGMSAIYIGDSSLSQINSPSEAGQRTVSNYIMLVTAEKPVGVPDRLQVYPMSVHALRGATLRFDARASDMHGYAAPLPADTALSVTQGLGELSPDGSFYASGQGSGHVSASSAGLLSGAALLKVVETPDEIYIYNEPAGSALSSLSLQTGQSVSLTARALSNHVRLVSDDGCFVWGVTGGVGSISADGSFTASDSEASGSITVSAGGMTVALPVSVRPPQRFSDVDPGEWYYDAIEYVAEKGLFNGVGDGRFAPGDTVTRAMLVTVLYRAAGSPPVSGGSGFSDVPENQWYTDAVIWAAEKAIVEGVGGGLFAPMDNVTREQVAAILYRYFGGAPSGSLDGFSDAGLISDWAVSPMRWAVSSGYIGGMGGGILNPRGNSTRAEAATILSRCF